MGYLEILTIRTDKIIAKLLDEFYLIRMRDIQPSKEKARNERWGRRRLGRRKEPWSSLSESKTSSSSGDTASKCYQLKYFYINE